MPSLPVSVAGFEAFGLADLGLQTSLAGSLGFEARLPRSLTVTLTGYAAQLRLTDVRDIDLTTIDPGAPDFLVSRRGRAYGAELLVRRADLGRLYGWLAYTLSWSRRQDESGVFGPSDWDQRHILNLVAGYRLPRRIRRRRAGSLQHGPARARHRQRRRLSDIFPRSTRWTCASRDASSSIGSSCPCTPTSRT